MQYSVPEGQSLTLAAVGGRLYDDALQSLYGGLTVIATRSDGSAQEYIFDNATSNWTSGFLFEGADSLQRASVNFKAPYASILTTVGNDSLAILYRDLTNDKDSWQLGSLSDSNYSSVKDGAICAGGNSNIIHQAPNGKLYWNSADGPAPWSTTWEDEFSVTAVGEDVGMGTALTGLQTFDDDGMLSVVYQSKSGTLLEAYASNDGKFDQLSSWQCRTVVI